MATTVNTLETNTEVFKGDRVVADGVERSLLDVTDSSTSLVSSIDPFGDGSLIYKLEMEDATATVGTNPTNTGVTFTTGNGGQFSEAGVFNGTSSRLSGTPGYTVGMSVSFWIKTSELTANMPITLFDVSGKGINIWGGVVYVQYANSNSSNAAANAIISSGVWTHVVGIFNTASSTSLYINGVLQSGTPVLNWVTTGTTPMIGSRGLLDAFLNGSLDQIEYYNRVLTAGEVNTLYTQTATKYSADFNTPLASIPTSVYRLDHDNLTILKQSNDSLLDDANQIAHYKLDGDATDRKGTYDGTATNVTYGAGQFGQAGVFNGTSSDINTGFTPSGACSYSAWFKSTATNSYSIVSSATTGSGGYNLDITASKLTGFGMSSTTSVNDGVWHHAVVTTNNTNENKIYVDGVLENSNSSATNPEGVVHIGRYGSLPYWFNGSIDQVRIFDEALTATEVESLYNEGLSTATTATVLDSRAGLIASGDTVLLDGVGVVCNPVVEGTVGSIVANDEFETVLYTGTGVTKTVPMTNITGGVDFVWLKERNGVRSHTIFDSIRGVSNTVFTDLTNAEISVPNNITALNASSFDVGLEWYANRSGSNYVAWCASLPNHTPSNTDGTITSETKSNSFMSVVSYTGTGANATVGHGLGVTPELVLIKNRIDASGWGVYNETVGNAGALVLNTTATPANGSGWWSNTSPTTSVISLGNYNDINGSGDNMIAYCFTSVAGKCKVGSYTGASIPNPVSVGFEPAWLMVKGTDTTGNWAIWDSVRGEDQKLNANLSIAEGAYDSINFTADGFTHSTIADVNANAVGGTYIFLAIAKEVDGTIPKYDLTYPTQTAPTRIALSNNDIVPTVASDTFDGVDTFTKTYNKVTKTARDVEYGFVADTDVEVTQLNINQNMEP